MIQVTRLIAAGTVVVFCQSVVTPAFGEEATGSTQEACMDEGQEEAPTTPDRFEAWLVTQCPDGGSIDVSNGETGDYVGTLSCEEVRATLLDYGPIREQWASIAWEQQEPGVAREPLLWSPASWICGVIFTFAIAYGCEKSRFNWATCGAIGMSPALACMLAF